MTLFWSVLTQNDEGASAPLMMASGEPRLRLVPSENVMSTWGMARLTCEGQGSFRTPAILVSFLNSFSIVNACCVLG